MSINKLLQKQLSKKLRAELLDDPDIQAFISVVNDSYNSYERELELSDRAFRFTEEEYVKINEQLMHELEVKKQSISSMMDSVDIELTSQITGDSDDLLVLADFLKNQLQARKNAEKVFTSLIDNSTSGILLRGADGKVLYVNNMLFELFSIEGNSKSWIGYDYSGLRDQIIATTESPEKFMTRVNQLLDEKKLVVNEKVYLKDGRILERDYIPIFVDNEYLGHLWKYTDVTDWQKAQLAISEGKLSSNLIIGAIHEGIVITDEQGKILHHNPPSELIFGKFGTAWQGKSITDLVRLKGAHASFSLIFSEMLSKVEAGMETPVLEMAIENYQGEEVFVEFSVLTLPQNNNKQIWCFFRNISERKNYEEQLLESRRLLTQSQEIAHIGSWEMDMRSRKIRWTDELFKIRGIEPDQTILTDDFFERFIHPEDLNRVKETIDEALMQRHSFDVKYRVARPDGSIRVLHDLGQPVYDEEGNLIKLQGVGQDITDQEAASQEIIIQKKFTEDILNNIPADIAVFDTSHRYLYVNPNGISDEHLRHWLIGKDDFEYCQSRGLSETVAVKRRHLFNMAVETKETQVWIDEHKNAKGQTSYVLRKFYPYFERGELRFVIGYGIDITERKEIEIQLSDALATMNKTNKDLERFAYVASHDLQEPLRMVSSFLNLLEIRIAGMLDETSRQYIDFAIDGAERMKNLIQALLQYSRLGYAKVGFENIDLNQSMSEILMVLQEKIKSKNAVVSFGELPVIRGSKTLISQVFLNLVSNGLKYNEHLQPTVEVGFEGRQEDWLFYVRDNGIGIDPKYFEKIFIIFQRLHGKSDYSGTGIGLSICQKIVEQHNGTIWVESVPDQGSTFYFTISKDLI